MQAIALEASVLSNVVSTIKNLFPDLVHNFRSSFVAATSINKVEIKFSKVEKELIDFLNKHSYINLMDTEITVPEGFNAEFLQAINTMDTNIEAISGLITKDISEFRTYVSTFITNKDTKQSLKDKTSSYNQAKIVIGNINTSFAELYKDNSFETTKPFKVLVKRNSDIEKVFTKLNTTKKNLNKVDIHALKSQMEDIASLLDTVIKMVNENKVETISPEAITNLAEGTQTIALIAETISASYFRSVGIITAIDRLPSELIAKYH